MKAKSVFISLKYLESRNIADKAVQAVMDDDLERFYEILRTDAIESGDAMLLELLSEEHSIAMKPTGITFYLD